MGSIEIQKNWSWRKQNLEVIFFQIGSQKPVCCLKAWSLVHKTDCPRKCLVIIWLPISRFSMKREELIREFNSKNLQANVLLSVGKLQLWYLCYSSHSVFLLLHNSRETQNQVLASPGECHLAFPEYVSIMSITEATNNEFDKFDSVNIVCMLMYLT